MRSLFGFFAATVVLMTSTGCNPVTIGISCDKREDCTVAQECITATGVPGGFCSKGCVTPGSMTECPNGTICTQFTSTVQLCSPTCTASTECRVNYTCAEVVAGTKACKPE